MQELNPLQWAIRPVRKYADFSGRAPRAEYWWYMLATGVVGLGLSFFDDKLGGPLIGVYGPLSLILILGLLIPGIAVTVRRFHDIDRSGWWALLNLWSYTFDISGLTGVPVERFLKDKGPAVGGILVLSMLVCIVLMLIFMITRGTEGPNRYGPDPHGPDALEEVFA